MTPTSVSLCLGMTGDESGLIRLDQGISKVFQWLDCIRDTIHLPRERNRASKAIARMKDVVSH